MIFSFEANVDSIFVAGYLIAVYFFLCYLRSDGGQPAMVLGGLAAGLALGTKPVGIVFIPPCSCSCWARSRRGPVRSGKGWLVGLAMLAGVVLTSGFWYGRNLILTGNPLYPLYVSLCGKTILQGWYGREAMRYQPLLSAAEGLAGTG